MILLPIAWLVILLLVNGFNYKSDVLLLLRRLLWGGLFSHTVLFPDEIRCEILRPIMQDWLLGLIQLELGRAHIFSVQRPVSAEQGTM